MRKIGFLLGAVVLLQGCDARTVVMLENRLSGPAIIALHDAPASFASEKTVPPGKTVRIVPEFVVSMAGCDYRYNLQGLGIGPLNERISLQIQDDMMIHWGRDRSGWHPTAPPGWPAAPTSKTCR